MNVSTVRDLIDIGISEIDELKGRSPEALFDQISSDKDRTPEDRLHHLRLAVYYAETDDPDPNLLEAWQWSNRSV